MTEENAKKVIKGGYRATLASPISIIAIILSIISFNRTVSHTDPNAEIKNLHEKLKEVKQETTERVNKIREDTGKAIEKIGKAIKKRGKLETVKACFNLHRTLTTLSSSVSVDRVIEGVHSHSLSPDKK
jgi:hypothetical protein